MFQNLLHGRRLQVFGASVVVFAPQLSRLIVAACGAVPMVVVARATAPFVTYIHLKIPFYARLSRDKFVKFLERIPPKTEIDLTTIKSFGLLRVQRMPVEELRKVKYTFSAANLVRIPPPSSTLPRRPWWKGSLPTKFYVGHERIKKGRGPTPWQKVWEQLKSA